MDEIERMAEKHFSAKIERSGTLRVGKHNR
jgi:hypothetical protein